MKKYVLFITIFSISCSKNISLYLGSGFHSESVTIIQKNKSYENYLIQDSILENNDVLGLTFYEKITFQQHFGNVIEFRVNDSIYNYEVVRGKSFYCDFYFNERKFSCKRLKRKTKFY